MSCVFYNNSLISQEKNGFFLSGGTKSFPFYSLEGEIVMDTGHTGSHASDTSSIQMNNTTDQV